MFAGGGGSGYGRRPDTTADALPMTPAEIAALQAHLRRLLGSRDLEVRAPQRRGGSVELWVGDEFLGTVHRDDEEGEVSYAVQMVVLAEDLPKPAAKR